MPTEVKVMCAFRKYPSATLRRLKGISIGGGWWA